MSDEIKELAADKPPVEYVEMSDAYAEPKREEKIYEGPSETDAVADAAADLTEARATTQPEPVQRKYVQIEDGQFTNKEVPLNETLDPERAARDLNRIREWEAHSVAANDLNIIANTVDQVKHDLGVQQEQRQQQQPQAEQQQQQPLDEQAEFERALANPKLRAALEQEVGKLEQSRAQYAQAAHQAFELSAASTFSQFPELNGVTMQTLPTVVNAIRQINPDRAVAIVRALQGTEQLHQASQQAKAAEQQIQQARHQIWAKGEDQKFEQQVLAQQPKETIENVVRHGARVLSESYGISVDELKQAFATNPALRSAPMQAALFDLVKTKLAREGIEARKARPPVPNVQRPGTSQPRASYNDEAAASALKAFNSSPDAKTAAAYLLARRAAKR
jgi:hypothetical protein